MFIKHALTTGFTEIVVGYLYTISKRSVVVFEGGVRFLLNSFFTRTIHMYINNYLIIYYILCTTLAKLRVMQGM